VTANSKIATTDEADRAGWAQSAPAGRDPGAPRRPEKRQLLDVVDDVPSGRDQLPHTD
jgi:hypothetical protein